MLHRFNHVLIQKKTNTQYNYLNNHEMNTNSTHLSMCEHSVAKLITQQSESQDDMNRSTNYYVFWKVNPGNGIQRGIEENKNEGDEVKGHLLLMKYKAL